MTMKEACEIIAQARILVRSDGITFPTAEEIYMYSSTGELYMIWTWLAIAKVVLEEEKRCLPSS
jgi:hypothetical protein